MLQPTQTVPLLLLRQPMQPKSQRWHMGKKHLPPPRLPELTSGGDISSWLPTRIQKRLKTSLPVLSFDRLVQATLFRRLIAVLQSHFFLQPRDTAALGSTKQTARGGNQAPIWDRQRGVWKCHARGHPSSEGPCHSSPGALGGEVAVARHQASPPWYGDSLQSLQGESQPGAS